MSATAAPLAEYPLPAAELSEPGRHLSLGLTLAVHLLLFAFLFFGVRWTTQVNDAIEVELVRAVPQPDAPATSAAKKAPERPVEPPSPPPQPARKPAPSLPKPDIALKEEKKEKPKPPAAAPVPPQVDPMQKQLEQELRRAQLERQKAEVAKAASALDQELADLQNKKQAMERARLANGKAMADYIGRIRSRIKSNIVLPPDIKGNPEAIFDVVQFPSGEILEVRLKKSSGHAGYDAAVERAIRKSSPLPKPERGDLFERNLELRFHPLED